jgi:hypothetical protein
MFFNWLAFHGEHSNTGPGVARKRDASFYFQEDLGRGKAPYSEAMNFRDTGDGTRSVWPVGVSRPELGSIRKTTMLLVS